MVYKIGPFSIVYFDLMHGEKAEKENNAWPKFTVNIYLSCFTGGVI